MASSWGSREESRRSCPGGPVGADSPGHPPGLLPGLGLVKDLGLAPVQRLGLELGLGWPGLGPRWQNLHPDQDGLGSLPLRPHDPEAPLEVIGLVYQGSDQTPYGNPGILWQNLPVRVELLGQLQGVDLGPILREQIEKLDLTQAEPVVNWILGLLIRHAHSNSP